MIEIDSLYYTYILKSELNQSHYYGHTSDLKNRLKRHNAGKVRSTKAYRPWNLIYSEEFATKSEAYQREQFFKSIDGYNFLKEKGII
jgi:putative endonuclease